MTSNQMYVCALVRVVLWRTTNQPFLAETIIFAGSFIIY